ncbi:MAG TPA: metallophosphoesterase [Candidatus Aenigmarchaeota archaeon]|nr:metallophosphoesterase [Candidatus Aenigmarchaeota archaeon]
MLEDSIMRYRGWLVLADLHIGYERELEEKGYNIPSQTKDMLRRIGELKKRERRLLILGDLKHNIPEFSVQEMKEVPYFVRRLKELFDRVVIIKGNHDGDIEKLVDVEVLKEFRVGKVGFLHGHARPSDELLERVKTLVIGHIHPVYRYEDSLGHPVFKSCWLIGRWRDKKLIVMPTFNPLFTGSQELTGPFAKEMEVEEIILTDLIKIV